MKSTSHIVLAIALLFTTQAQAQGSIYTNNSIVIDTGVTMYVEGAVRLETANSSIVNNGTILLKGDWENNSSSIALLNNGKGKVVFDGGTQHIKGTHYTLFKQLVLNQSNELKSFEINTKIDSLLEINGAILETNGNFVELLNPNSNALAWSNNGFISTNTLGGQFLRKTNSNTVYVFPVGNSNLNANYRVVEITPTSTDTNVYGVALIAQSVDNVSGTSVSGAVAPFYSTDKEDRIEAINTQYFHTIYPHQGNDSAQINIYFFSEDTENIYTSVAQWNNNKWEDQAFQISSVLSPMANYGMPNRVAQKSNVNNFSSDVFAFVETELFVPNGFTPNNDGINDNFEIKNIEQYPNNELVILNRWGNEIYKASPYQNDWNGQTNVEGVYLQGKTIKDGTYFYILKLNDNLPVLKGYIEVKKN